MEKSVLETAYYFFWEGRCDGGLCRYWIWGKEQQYYSSWLKQTKTFTRFIKVDFIINVMSWSYIYFCLIYFRVESQLVIRQRVTAEDRNKLSATKNFWKLVCSFSKASPWTAHFLIHSINENTSPLANGLLIRGPPFLRNDSEY